MKCPLKLQNFTKEQENALLSCFFHKDLCAIWIRHLDKKKPAFFGSRLFFIFSIVC